MKNKEKNKWRLEKYSIYCCDFVHCQKNDEDLRVSCFGGKQKKGLFLTTKYTAESITKLEEKNFICPLCKEPIPEYLIFQAKLLLD